MTDPGGLTLPEWLAALAAPLPTPAAGAAAFVQLAQCAALSSKLAKLSGCPQKAPGGLAERFLAHARDDSATYGLPGSLELELLRAQEALCFLEGLADTPTGLPEAAKPDLEAVRAMARAAAGVLLANLRFNLGRGRGGAPSKCAAEVVELQKRLEAVVAG